MLALTQAVRNTISGIPLTRVECESDGYENLTLLLILAFQKAGFTVITKSKYDEMTWCAKEFDAMCQKDG